jgi:murein DD-endopeptidase MepM/ murein hydrolase activator NlpD
MFGHRRDALMHRPMLRLLLLMCLAVAVAAAPTAGAQGEPSPTTVDPTQSSTTSTTSTTVESPTTGPDESTSTTAPPTTLPAPLLPPELIADPRAPFLVDPGPGDGADIPIAQNSFDPLSVAVRPELVAAATAAVEEAEQALAAARAEVAAQTERVAALTAELDAIEQRGQAAVRAAADARKALSDRAVSAYLVGDLDQRLALLDTADLVDIGVARNYVGVVGQSNSELVRRYERARQGLSRDQVRLADDLAAASVELDQRTQAVGAAGEVLAERLKELQAFQAGAQAYIDGFVFPVAGDVEFIDSWGYPRMLGTSSAHWHQGTDVFAAHGTPLIASENGVLSGIGVGSLGGNKLWVDGDSGTEYYYAHLAAFAPGIANGQRVRAGEVVGYVGDTGNAKGTSPHLHFEIHPGGVGPVNPYPILKAAYGNRPVARAEAPVTTTTVAPPAAPAPAEVAGG